MSNRKVESLGRSSGKISLATAGSRVTGLLRETVFAYLFGSGFAADAFFAATRIPNLLRDLFAEGALGAAFVPIVSEQLTKRDEKAAFDLVNRMIVALAVTVGAAVLLGIIFAPWIVSGLAPGFADVAGKTELTTRLVRWTFPYLWLISLAALIAGSLNAMHRFGVPASAPIMFNIANIATALLFYSVFDPPVVAMAAGVVVGALAQLAFQWPTLKRAGFKLNLQSPLGDPDTRRVFKLMLPVALGLAALQLNNLATTFIATLLPEGSLSYLSYAFRLMHFPLGVFAVAVGTAVLPRASAQAAVGNIDALRETYGEGVRLAAFLVAPAAAFLVLFPEAIVAIVYQRGAFSAGDTAATSSALRMYAIGLAGYTGVRVTAPIFYAQGDTKTPMRVAMAAVALNIILNILLAWPMGFAGLALANAIAGTLNFTTLVYLLQKRYTIALDASRMRAMGHVVTDTLLAGVVAYLVWWQWSETMLGGSFGRRLAFLMALGALFMLVYFWRAVRPTSDQRKLLRKLIRR
jgi:putative peptidoglycan lipid II flippase